MVDMQVEMCLASLTDRIDLELQGAKFEPPRTMIPVDVFPTLLGDSVGKWIECRDLLGHTVCMQKTCQLAGGFGREFKWYETQTDRLASRWHS